MTAGSFKYAVATIKSRPTALVALTGLNIVIGAVLGVLTLTDGSHSLLSLLCVSDSVSDLLRHPWTALTYAFVNGNLLQLVFNMLWLYCFGRLFLMKAGNTALVITYSSAAVCGAIAYAVIYPVVSGQTAPSLLMGSSAAVIAVAVAVAVMIPDTELRLPLFGPVKIKWITGVVVVIFCIGLTAPNAGGNLAHLGGALAGAIAGLVIRTRHRNERSEHRRADEYGRLVDKVRTAGYESLSSGEKRRFFELSASRHKS